jgi:hypothetical protein
LSVGFVPQVDTICSYLALEQAALKEPNSNTVIIKVELLRLLLEQAIAHLPFDPDWYCKNYPDIREALADGKIKDVRAHFLAVGFFEGRRGTAETVDEHWYVRQYPDVGAAIAAGRIENATRHYQAVGQREWRAPSADALEAIRRWREALLT